MVKPCERCTTEEAVVGERYCKKCKKIVLTELKAAGLVSTYTGWRRGSGRTSEAHEDTYETKHGIDR